MAKRKELPADWSCEEQLDLLDLVDTEHINGGMPADDEERELERQKFYAQLTGGTDG